MTDEAIIIEAPAKINLYLHITGKRTSGLHEIDSLVIFTTFGDSVHISPSKTGEGIRFSADGPFANKMGSSENNLVVRAAHMMTDLCQPIEKDIDIHLTKRLPVAAGVGGGSSNAAATLSALNHYWGAGLEDNQLVDIGLCLGADVPMCLSRRPIFVSGIGDIISPAPELPPFSLVLVNPNVAVPTPAVFKAFNGNFTATARFESSPGDVYALAGLLDNRVNDLHQAACKISPVINDVLTSLESQEGCLLSRMSGSGASCYGLFAKSHEAQAAHHTIHTTHPNWWCNVMTSL